VDAPADGAPAAAGRCDLTHNLPVRVVPIVLAVCALAAAAAARGGDSKTVVVVVTAGKPTELAFRVSRSAALPLGTVAFRVVNAGRRPHGFRLCTAPVAGSAANACAGKATASIRPGGSATLTVALSKPGRYEFISTSPAEARAGMKGLLAVVAPAPAPSAGVPATTTTATVAAPASTFGPSGAPCSSPRPTTVNVTAFEFGFTISQSTVPCGLVTWVITDTGNLQHNFNVFDLFSSRGGFISPGETISAPQNLLPGTYQYYCDFTGHIAFGMVGTIVVTP
jgi:plastocyanin